MKKQWFLLLTLIFALLIVLFSIANVDNVTFSFLFGKARLPLILVIIGSVLLGALLVGSFTYMKLYRQQRRIRQLEREIRNSKEMDPEGQKPLEVKNTGSDEVEESRFSGRRSRNRK
ncbi:MAG: lipopolysaccharide assembly LapA domain-containing protein [Sporolactobacillus sp.]